MSEYSEFFLNSSSRVIQLELLEITHPSFTKAYRIVRNAIYGVTVTLEAGGGVANFQYYPIKVSGLGSQDDLEQNLRLEVGDLGQVLPKELDAVYIAETFNIKPELVYRVYRSDDLTAPIFGPIKLEVVNITFNSTGALIDAKAPLLNHSATGELYRIDRFPMLRGFL